MSSWLWSLLFRYTAVVDLQGVFRRTVMPAMATSAFSTRFDPASEGMVEI